MRKIYILTGLTLALAISAHGQVSNPSIIPVPSDPTGIACSQSLPNEQYQGTMFTCKGGVWTASGLSAQYPLPISSYEDAFAGSSLNSNWTAYVNGFNVSNSLVTGNAATISLAAYTGGPSNPSQHSTVVIGATGTDFAAAAVRISGTIGTSVSFYECAINNTNIGLYKVTGASNASSGTATQLGTAAGTYTMSVGDTIDLSIVGNTLVCSVNGVEQYSFNDTSSPLTSGLPGFLLASNGTGTSLRNVYIANVAPPSNVTDNIVFDGDSITALYSSGVTGLFISFTRSLTIGKQNSYSVNIGVPGKCLGVTCGTINGGSIESMITTGTSVVDPLLKAGANNIVVIWGGTNDLAGGRTLAQVETDLSTYVAARKAAGWKVVVIPTISRMSGTIALDSSMQQFAAYIAANSFGADAIVSLPNLLAGPGAASNTTYFNSDKLHPLEYSHLTIIAPAVIAALSQVQ